ncbi:Transcriptional repressor CTCFL [Frankliniella fusca]|uniref:Transcriptional repressor CTCFL n=1 Tax=Frankliniella fusca TaxID=407009 RepID=A0AAE1HZI1_9NEOP|nr:Transcriptional repressor CTCFL [Frankliniella fusca]
MIRRNIQRKCLLCINCNPPVFFKTTAELSRHFKYRHVELTKFTCGHCRYAFMQKTSWVRHVNAVLAENQENVSDEGSDSNDDTNEHSHFEAHGTGYGEDQDNNTGDGNDGGMEVCDQEVPPDPPAVNQFDMETEAAIFLMNLRSSGDITGASVEVIQKYTKDLLVRVVSGLRQKVSVYLQENSENLEDNENFLKETFEVKDPFEKLKSTDDQLQFLSDKFGLVIPEEKNLILSEKKSTDGVYRSFKDGSDFENDDFLQKYPDALRIEPNHDGLETANGMACSEDLNKKGAWSKILVPLREDLKRLKSDEGVPVDLPEGDTLAAHAIMGFMSPSAAKFCQFCLISMAELKESSTSIGQLRTSELHQQHLRQIQDNPALKSTFGVESESSLSQLMRIPENNVLDAFHDFVGVIHMFNSNLTTFVYGSPEVKNKPSANITVDRLLSKGHGLKQSGAQTFCLLRTLPFVITGVEKGDRFLELVFLLQDILRITFSFELTQKDIQDLELLIHQHNSLFHELFVTVSERPAEENEENDNNPDDDPDNDFSFQDVNVNVHDEPGPSAAITSGGRRRRHVTKQLKKGINKLHHILHYPKQMLENGPLIRLWCARYEGRHLIFRRHSHVQCNFRNVPKTMAEMYQLRTLKEIVFRKEPDTVISSASELILVKNSSYCDALVQQGLSEEDSVQVENSVDYQGVDYSSGLFVTLVSQDELRNSTPKFGLIFEIVVEVRTSKVFLAVIECVNEGLDGRFNSFKIRNLYDAPPALMTIESRIMEHLDVDALARELAKHMPSEIVDLPKAQKITGEDFMSLTDQELITFSFPLGYVRTIRRVREKLSKTGPQDSSGPSGSLMMAINQGASTSRSTLTSSNVLGENSQQSSCNVFRENSEQSSSNFLGEYSEQSSSNFHGENSEQSSSNFLGENSDQSSNNFLGENSKQSSSYNLLLEYFSKAHLESLSEYEIKGLLAKAERCIEMKEHGLELPDNPFRGMVPSTSRQGVKRARPRKQQGSIEASRKSARLLFKPTLTTEEADGDEDDDDDDDDDGNKENENETLISFRLAVFPKTSDQLKEMSPQLINIDVVKILEEHAQGKKLVPLLQDCWILVETARKLMYRILMNHLCYIFMDHPNKVTVTMREGLAKSITVAFPQYQRPFESEGKAPWSSVHNHLNNVMKRIQTKLPEEERLRKGKAKVKAKPLPQPNVNALAILNADRENKHAILDGMKQTYAHRCNDRRAGLSITEIIEKYPHFVHYNGEVISEEFRRMKPEAKDLCAEFVTLTPKILEHFGSRVNNTMGFIDDSVMACYALALKLPHPIVEGGSRRKERAPLSAERVLDEMIVVVPPSVDVPILAAEKRESVKGPVQPYLMGIMSPITKKIKLKHFLILDSHAVDLGATPTIRAIDLLFKCCFVFNVHYPASWNLLFRFLQTCLYKIFISSEDDAHLA